MKQWASTSVKEIGAINITYKGGGGVDIRVIFYTEKGQAETKINCDACTAKTIEAFWQIINQNPNQKTALRCATKRTEPTQCPNCGECLDQEGPTSPWAKFRQLIRDTF